jgi:hypothetical protein
MPVSSAFAIILSLCILCSTAFPQDQEYPIKPHAETQELIAKWIETAQAASPGQRVSDAQLKEHYALLARLIPLANDDYHRFVQQVVYAHHRREEMGKGVLLGDLFNFVPDLDVATALVPYLYGPHGKVRDFAWRMLLYLHCKDYPPGYTDLTHLMDGCCP